MLYPANMQTHGPSRSMEEYLAWLYVELDKEPCAPLGTTARANDLTARIRAIEDEIEARAAL